MDGKQSCVQLQFRRDQENNFDAAKGSFEYEAKTGRREDWLRGHVAIRDTHPDTHLDLFLARLLLNVKAAHQPNQEDFNCG